MTPPQEVLSRRELFRTIFKRAKQTAVIAPVILAAACEDDGGIKWDHYGPSVLRYEMDYPSGWYIQHNPQSDEFREVADSSKFSTNVLIHAEPVSPSISLPEYQRKIEQVLIEEIKRRGGVKGLEGGTIKVNGQEAALAKGTIPREAPPIYVNGFPEHDFRTAIFIAGGSGWTVMLSAVPSDMPIWEKRFPRMLSSFKVK